MRVAGGWAGRWSLAQVIERVADEISDVMGSVHRAGDLADVDAVALHPGGLPCEGLHRRHRDLDRSHDVVGVAVKCHEDTSVELPAAKR